MEDEIVLILGSVDVSHLIKEKGYKIVKNGVDGPNAGRTIGSATMIRDLLANKFTATATCMDLNDEEADYLFSITDEEYITATYRKPGGLKTGPVYCASIPGVLVTNEDGIPVWSGVEIVLVEQ